jgi:hypothetical protein
MKGMMFRFSFRIPLPPIRNLICTHG